MIWVWFLNSVAVYVTAGLLSGIEIKNFWTAVVVAALLAVVNTLLRPILLLISLPVTILTLGLFVFVVDALLILLIDKLVDGFRVKSFVWAVLFAIVMSPISYLLHKFFA